MVVDPNIGPCNYHVCRVLSGLAMRGSCNGLVDHAGTLSLPDGFMEVYGRIRLNIAVGDFGSL